MKHNADCAISFDLPCDCAVDPKSKIFVPPSVARYFTVTHLNGVPVQAVELPVDPFALIDMAEELRLVFELEDFTPALQWARDLEGKAGMILEREGIIPDAGIIRKEDNNDDT